MGDQVNKPHIQLALAWVHGKSEGEVDGIYVCMREEDELHLASKQQHVILNKSQSVFFPLAHANVISIELQDDMCEKRLFGQTSMAIKVFPCLG